MANLIPPMDDEPPPLVLLDLGDVVGDVVDDFDRLPPGAANAGGDDLPVREGETVVIGIQNSPGSTLMTISDMSVITAEVQMDETDIVNVKLGQPAEVTIDAIPKKTFKAVVTEIGNNAIVRSTGVSTSQQTSASQEAMDKIAHADRRDTDQRD